MRASDNRLIAVAGIALIVVGLAGLATVGAAGWVWPDNDWLWQGWGPAKPWGGARPPAGRGFGRPDRRPWWGGPTAPIAGARAVQIVVTETAVTPQEIRVAPGEPVNLTLVNQTAAVRHLMLPSEGVVVTAPPGGQAAAGLQPAVPGEIPFFVGPSPGRAPISGRIVVAP